MRWSAGFGCSGDDFQDFWSGLSLPASGERRGLLIAGRGFDPRTTVGPEAMVASGFPIIACRLIRLTRPPESRDRPRSIEAERNEGELRALFPDVSVDVVEVAVRNESGRLAGSSHILAPFLDRDWLGGFTDVVVDISALPTSVSFPLLGGLISLSDELRAVQRPSFDLHCIVCENVDVDERIVSEGGDVAEYIDPFRGRGGLAGEADPIKVWAPVLGERQESSLRKIHEMLGPDEVNPVLPFPSRNPRRGDDLVSEYRSLLFDTWEVNSNGFIYADERDPFDIYRQLGELSDDYERSLKPLGPVRTVVSTHTSKLLSLGVLLAGYDYGLAIAHVEPTGYRLDGPEIDHRANELFELWLTGEPYDGA